MDGERDSSRASWNTHALITGEAVRFLSSPDLSQEVIVTDLTDFLDRAAGAIPEMVRWNRSLVHRTAGGAFNSEARQSAVQTEADFIRAFQLNPSVKFHLVRLLNLLEVSEPWKHNPSRGGPPDPLYIGTPVGCAMSALDVLRTFADEPDWGMDQDLFVVDGYGYGRPPFGIATGASSQGAFHMAFFHERPMLTWLLPQLRRSFLVDRVTVFFGLADLAFRIGSRYWGWRFTAWAMHYLQDLTQPYHARAYPPAVHGVLMRLISRREEGRAANVVAEVLKSHHMLFEAVFHFLLNEEVKGRSRDRFTQALRDRGDAFEGPLATVARECSRNAARLAPLVDRLLMKLLDGCDVSRDETSVARICHTIGDVMEGNPETYARFADAVGTCLQDAGRVTRYAIASSAGRSGY